jgi:ArsR family transcriptional regulator, arsenate/arsenite/antimonite-responsive transcriptional repressor
MDIDFARGTSLIKALADETRVRIVHILSCGELCACDIQDYFNLTQPTLSHHLTLLVEAGLVIARPEGKWTYYSLSEAAFGFLETFITEISRESDTCLCKKEKRKCN